VLLLISFVFSQKQAFQEIESVIIYQKDAEKIDQ